MKSSIDEKWLAETKRLGWAVRTGVLSGLTLVVLLAILTADLSGLTVFVALAISYAVADIVAGGVMGARAGNKLRDRA